MKLLNGEVLRNADDIRREYETSTGVLLKVWMVRKVIRNLLDLHYTKIV